MIKELTYAIADILFLEWLPEDDTYRSLVKSIYLQNISFIDHNLRDLGIPRIH